MAKNNQEDENDYSQLDLEQILNDLTQQMLKLPDHLQIDLRRDIPNVSIIHLAIEHNINYTLSPYDLLPVAVEFLKRIIKDAEFLEYQIGETRADQRYRVAKTLKQLGYNRASLQVLTNNTDILYSRPKQKLNLHDAVMTEIEYLDELAKNNGPAMRFIIKDLPEFNSREKRKAASIADLIKAFKGKKSSQEYGHNHILSLVVNYFTNLDGQLSFLQRRIEETLQEYRFRITITLCFADLENIACEVMYNSFVLDESMRHLDVTNIRKILETTNTTEQSITLKNVISDSSKKKYWQPSSVKNIPGSDRFIDDEYLPIDLMQVAVESLIALDSRLDFLKVPNDESLIAARARIVKIFYQAGYHRMAFQILLNKEHINDSDYAQLDTDTQIWKIVEKTEQELAKKYQKNIRSRSLKDDLRNVKNMLVAKFRSYFQPVDKSGVTTDPP